MKKRVLAIAMSLAMTLSLLPVSALAAETGETPEEKTQQSISTNELSETTEDTEATADDETNSGEEGKGGPGEGYVVQGPTGNYLTIEAALDAVPSPTSVKLIGNLEEDVVIPEGKTLTIDLDGFKITNKTGHTITVNSGAQLIINDSSAEKTGTVDNVTHAKAAVHNAAGGTVTLSGGNYTRSQEANNSASSSGGNSFYTIQNYGDMTLNEGITVSQGANGRGQFSSLIENGYYDGSGKSQNATMTINGGTFIGGLNTVKNDDWGILTVNGGNFTNYAQYAFFNANIATINGGTFVNEGTRGAIYSFAHWNDNYGIGKLTITGGTFKNNGTSIIEVTADDADVSITGGTFSSDVSAYVPENYECVENEGEDTYTVKEMEAKLVVKQETDESGNISATLEGNYSSSGTTEIEKPTTGAGSETPTTATHNVEIDLTTTGTTEATTGSTTLKITQATANSLADASSLKVTTNEGTVELDNDALEKVGKASGEVSITVTKNSTASENNVAASYTVKVQSDGTDLLSDGESGNGTITLTLPVPAASQGTTLFVWYAVEQGSSVMYVDRVGTYNADSGAVVTFDVSHLSRYDLLSENPTTTAVASITENGETTYYDSLQAAVNAVTDNTQTTIKLLKTMEGNGVKVEATKNIIFDLNEKTYTINTKTVGSTGTETNGFQLLKGNTITIKNGTLKPGDSAKILLQNYSDLTLENVTVDCRGATQCQYAMSNNYGNVVVTGNTNIYAAEGQVAFDLWYGMSSTYYDGVTVKFDENMTGTVEGKVEYGASSNQEGWMEKTNLKIENGNFIISFASTGSYVSDISEANIDVSGGNFSQPVDENYLDDSLTAQLYSTRKNPDAPYSYYASVEAAINASQAGDTVTDLNATTTDTCTVTINYGYGSNSTIQVASDTKISLPAPGTRAGYTFNGWRSSADNDLHKAGTSVTITKDTTFTASWTPIQSDRPSSGNSGSSSSDSGDYLISVDRVSGGRVTVQPGRADKGDTVTITVYPNDGYELDELVVTDSRGNEIDLDARSATRFTFTMPGGKVTVEASFVREGGQTQTPQTTFADVPASAWYYNAVEYVYENGLMSGVSGGRFAPDDTLTRAMLVQTLYAMEGRPAAASAGFADVASGDWYASAVNWAAANGVVSGVSETGFGPNNALTREQLALILYRFAQYKGYDVTGTSDLAAYADGSSVSGWAAEAMGWAVDAGLISGVGGNQIAPTGTASRAQVAQILMNFCENVAR